MVVVVVVRMMEEGMGTSQNSMKNGMRKQHLNSCPNIWTRNIFLNLKLLKNKMRFQCFQSLGSFWGWLEWKAWGQCVCSQHELWRTARESPPLPLQNRRITHFQVWREDSNDFHWLWTKNKLGACKKSKQKKPSPEECLLPSWRGLQVTWSNGKTLVFVLSQVYSVSFLTSLLLVHIWVEITIISLSLGLKNHITTWVIHMCKQSSKSWVLCHSYTPRMTF